MYNNISRKLCIHTVFFNGFYSWLQSVLRLDWYISSVMLSRIPGEAATLSEDGGQVKIDTGTSVL